MKRSNFLKAFVVAALVFVASGCYKVDFDASFDNDGSGSLSYIIAINYEAFAELSEQSGEATSKEEICSENGTEPDISDLPDNAKVAPYDQDGFCGVSVELEIPENDNVMEELAGVGGQDELDGLVIEKVSDDTWKFSQPSDAAGVAGGETDQLDAAILESLEISYKVTLPGAAGENNAEDVSTKDGKTTFSWGSDSVLGTSGLKATTVPKGSAGEVAASNDSGSNSSDSGSKDSNEASDKDGGESNEEDVKNKDSEFAVASENAESNSSDSDEDSSDESDEEEASSDKDGGFPIMLAVGAPIIMLAVAGGAFLLIRSRKSNKSSPMA